MWPVLYGVLGMLPFGVNFCCASAAFGVTIEPALAAAAPIVTPRRFRRSRRVTCCAMGVLLAWGCLSLNDDPNRGECGSSAPIGTLTECPAFHHGTFQGVKTEAITGANGPQLGGGRAIPVM